MTGKVKIMVTVCVAAVILVVVVGNFIRARHETAHNSAIDSLRQPMLAVPSNSPTINSNGISQAQ